MWWEPRPLSPGITQPGFEADHSPLSRAKFKNESNELYCQPTIYLHGAELVTSRDSFIF
jgi:hypothetical protein